MFQATLSVLGVALCATLSASSRVGSQDGSCAQGQAAPLRIAPPFAHEDNQLELQYADQRHLALRELGPRLALLSENLGKVTYHGEEYIAQRAEIRSPAEHILGKHRSALEVQIFHRASSGKTLGVSILFQVGSSRSRFLDAVLQTLHKKGAPGKARPVVLAQGLGKFLSQRSDYFSYAASSCDSDSMALGGPVVDHWVVLSKMKRVTADQLVLLQKLAPQVKQASRTAQNRAPQTILYSTRAKKEKPAPQTPAIAMVQKATVATTVASKSRYSAVLAEQATEQYKEWQRKVDAYELQVQEARQRYQARFNAISGTVSKEQLQQEQQKYVAWEQGVRVNEVQLQQQRALYIKRLQSFQNMVQGRPNVAAPEEKSHVAAKQSRRKEAFVNVASSTHTVSEEQADMQNRLAALLKQEKMVAEAERHVAEKEKQLQVREKQDSKKELTLSSREQKDVKREQDDTLREQKDLQLEQQEKYLQAQIQQSQQILYQEAAGLQAREMQAAQATQAARAAQVAAQQVQAQAEQVLAYTNPQRMLVQKGRAKAETKADAETFRFQLGSSVHTVRNGQVTPPAAAQPMPAAVYAQPMVAPQVPQQMAAPAVPAVPVMPPAPQALQQPVPQAVQQPVPAAPQAVQQPVPAAPQAPPMPSAQAQEQAAQLFPGATVINHGAPPKQALLQVKQLNKVQHNAVQKAAPPLPSMDKALKNMPAADADNDDDFPPPPDVDIPGHVDEDHEDA
jgi:carbonic anhydrase